MKPEDLKKELIVRIQNSSDDLLLEDIFKFFELNEKCETYHLSKEEERAVNTAKESIRDGLSYTQKEVDEKLKKWGEE